MAFLLRVALTGFALWIVTLVVSGIDFVGGDTTLQRIGIILVVALIFGLVNAIIKPIVQIISLPLYILTLGLIHVVINALMLWITSWITENTTHWGLYIDDFWWTAIWAAIVLSVVSWALSLIVRDTQPRHALAGQCRDGFDRLVDLVFGVVVVRRKTHQRMHIADVELVVIGHRRADVDTPRRERVGDIRAVGARDPRRDDRALFAAEVVGGHARGACEAVRSRSPR